MNGYLITSARVSDCGRYRYSLHRTWAIGGPWATFIMLNPSTADADQDDPTIRRCVGFAKELGCTSLAVVNLYAYRSTNPSDLRTVDDPVGPENDWMLSVAAQVAANADSPLVAAWGANAEPLRVREVLDLPHMERLTALGTTKDGHPRHPLYLPATARPEPWLGLTVTA